MLSVLVIDDPQCWFAVNLDICDLKTTRLVT